MNGSYFISALVKVFNEVADEEHLLDMLTEVNRIVAESSYHGGTRKQMPKPEFTLRKKLYFNPGK